MKQLVLMILMLVPWISFGQEPDTAYAVIATIERPCTIKGEVVQFCNGLSLDFGEHPGLLIIKEIKTDLVYNILLNPYEHYDYQINETVKVKVEPFPDHDKTVNDIQPMCEGIGNVFVNKRD